MSDDTPQNPYADPPATPDAVPPPPPAPPLDPYGTAPAPGTAYGTHAAYGAGPATGKIRGTGMCILLCIVTLGIYSYVWFYSVHDEMKRHTGQGLGGGLALVLAFLVGIVMPYITSSEVGGLYERAGQQKPVSGATGLWNFPGIFLIVGPLVWFIKTNNALNEYWRSQGVVEGA